MLNQEKILNTRLHVSVSYINDRKRTSTPQCNCLCRLSHSSLFRESFRWKKSRGAGLLTYFLDSFPPTFPAAGQWRCPTTYQTHGGENFQIRGSGNGKIQQRVCRGFPPRSLRISRFYTMLSEPIDRPRVRDIYIRRQSYDKNLIPAK